MSLQISSNGMIPVQQPVMLSSSQSSSQPTQTLGGMIKLPAQQSSPMGVLSMLAERLDRLTQIVSNLVNSLSGTPTAPATSDASAAAPIAGPTPGAEVNSVTTPQNQVMPQANISELAAPQNSLVDRLVGFLMGIVDRLLGALLGDRQGSSLVPAAQQQKGDGLSGIFKGITDIFTGGSGGFGGIVSGVGKAIKSIF